MASLTSKFVWIAVRVWELPRTASDNDDGAPPPSVPHADMFFVKYWLGVETGFRRASPVATAPETRLLRLKAVPITDHSPSSVS
jgi:hypothetical protein